MSYLKELHVAHSDFFSLVDVWNPEQLPSAQIFDDVVMCATVGCSCFIINTGDGLILMDAMLPVDACYENIVGAVEKAGWDINDLKMIFITHGHFDHSGVTARLKAQTGAKVYFPAADYEMWRSEWNVERTRGNIARRGVDIPPVVADFEADVLLEDGDEIYLGHTTVKCVSTPGHTKGGCCYYIASENIVFTGDTLFALSIGRTDFAGGSYPEICKSIKEKLFVLPDETICYCGHGEGTRIGYEKGRNPYVR